MQNIVPNTVGGNSKLAAWTPVVVSPSSAPVGTESDTSGANSTPGETLSSTGTSGGIQAQATVSVPSEGALFLSCYVKASSTAPTLTPFSVVFKDAAGNAIGQPSVPVAGAVAADASNHYQFNATVGVPVGARTAVVTMAKLTWASTGGYSCVLSHPLIVVP